MNKISENNQRIAKNTLLLYFRMFVTMVIGLYTSRVVLNVLGVEDFGIYNVVGGIITMVSFLNSAMVQATQRYLSFELGRGDNEKLNQIFCVSINIHFVICVIALLLGETVGLWFVNSKLNIPDGRMWAANWVYQASIITFIVTVMSVPYNSAIVAHEKMSAFAYISILEVTLKLLIVYLLLLIPYDKLIIYSILMVIVGVSIRLCYTVYCKKKFKECSYHYINDKKLTLDIFSFAGWSIFGNLGFSFKDQISNIILNLFYGTTVNAARGVSIHVAALINTFATNFIMAINPQITKQYAIGNISASRDLVYLGCRFSFYLLSLFSIPIIVNIDYILTLWLGIVPDYTSEFVIYALLTSLLYSMSGCVTTAIQATGRMKWFQIGISIIMLSELPVAWYLLKDGFSPYAVMWPTLMSYTIALLFRFFLLHKYVTGYSFYDYIIGVFLRCILIFGLSIAVCEIYFKSQASSFFDFVLSFSECLFLTGIIIFIFGLKKNERVVLLTRIKKIAYAQ